MSTRFYPLDDGGYYSPFAQAYRQYGRRAGWEVILSLGNISNGLKWDVASYPAIVDDFGDLVAVAGLDGKVELW